MAIGLSQCREPFYCEPMKVDFTCAMVFKCIAVYHLFILLSMELELYEACVLVSFPQRHWGYSLLLDIILLF